MSNSYYDAYYRSVNLYTDPTTGEEYFEYTKAYNKPGPAKAASTNQRFVGTKGGKLKRIPNKTHLELKDRRMGWGGRLERVEVEVPDTFYEFTDTWVEYAKVWERV